MMRTCSIHADVWLKDHAGLVAFSPLTCGFDSHREFNFNLMYRDEKGIRPDC